MTSTIDLEKFKSLLLTRRQTLQTVKTNSDLAAEIVELDQARMGRLSRMDALQNQAMLQETGRRRDQELVQIAAALQRIEQDDYGCCEVCGEIIAKPRLEFNPAAINCIACATKTEEHLE